MLPFLLKGAIHANSHRQNCLETIHRSNTIPHRLDRWGKRFHPLSGSDHGLRNQAPNHFPENPRTCNGMHQRDALQECLPYLQKQQELGTRSKCDCFLKQATHNAPPLRYKICRYRFLDVGIEKVLHRARL